MNQSADMLCLQESIWSETSMSNIGGLAGPRTLADGVPRSEFGIYMHSWSPPQAALNIACLTKDCTNAPNFPQHFQTIIIIAPKQTR